MRSRVAWMGLIGTCILAVPGLQASIPGTFRISTTPATFDRSTVVSDAAGNFVVVWKEPNFTASRVSGRILARRFDAELKPVGQTFRINSVIGSTFDPAVAMDAGGGFAVTWQQIIDNKRRLLVRLFDPSGTPLGAEIEVSEATSARGGAVSRADNGDTCVTWEEQAPGRHSSVFIRTFDPLGAPLSDPVELGMGGPDTAIDDHRFPAVAAGADGRFFVAWSHGIDTESVLLGQLVNRDATLSGERSTVLEDDASPSVSRGTDGGFLVSWIHEISGPEPLYGVSARLYDGQGQARGDVTEIVRDRSLGGPAVSADGRGGFLAVWLGESSTGDSLIYGQHLDSAGAPIGGKLLVVAPDPAFYSGLDLAATVGGDLVVTLHRQVDPNSQFEVLGRGLAAELAGGTFHLTRLPTELEVLGIGENGFTGGLPSTVSVWRTGGSSGQVRLRYRTLEGSATAGQDYVPLDGTVTFQDGDLRADIDLEVLDDPLFEGDEDFFVQLDDGGAGRLLEPSRLRVDVLDDDFAPPGPGPAAIGPAAPIVVGGGGDRISPSLAAAEGEGVVMAWVEKRAAPGSERVRAARFGMDGRRTGEVIELGRGTQPSVTSGPGGDVSVAWQRGESIYWRRFDSSGRPLGEPVIVAETASAPSGNVIIVMLNPRIVRLADGSDAVMWIRRTFGSVNVIDSVLLRKVDAGGEPGAELTTVDSDHTLQGYDSALGLYALAAEPAGSLLAAFSDQAGTFVQRFDADMQPVGERVLLSEAAFVADLDLAAGPAGTFMVVWEEEQSSGFWTDVLGRRMARDLTPLGPAFRVSRSTAKSQTAARVAADPTGGFLVVWQSEDQDGSGWGVFGQRFDAEGSRLGGEFRVNDAVAGNQTGPQTAIDSSGRLFAAWASEDAGSTDVLLRAFGTAGCAADERRLCLQQDRFAVDVTWRDSQGKTGPGRTRPMTPDTGAFWFFSEANVELMVKVLDGTGINGHYWVFFGSLTNVEFTLTVTDTMTGVSKSYVNAAGKFASRGDVTAFLGE